MAIVELENIRKAYDLKVAVEGLSLAIEPGTMFGLLGPNGSGKSSTIRMMIGITRPDSGTVRLFGKPFERAALHRVGYLPEERGLYKKMKVIEQLVFFGQLHGLEAGAALTRAKVWCERMQIADAMEKKTEELSKGMQQKIQFIASLLHDPELVIMDEPFSGLDPVNATLLMDTLVDLRKQGKAIVFSTHRMDQVEKLCESIAILYKGRLVLSGTMREIKSRYPANRIQTQFSGDASFLSHPAVAEAKNYSGIAELKLVEGADAQAVLAQGVAAGTRFTKFDVMEPTLEEIFIETVGENVDAYILLIAKREYLERVRTKAFIIATLLIPVLLGGIGFGGSYLSRRTQSAAHLTLLTDGAAADQQFARDLQTKLHAPDEDGKPSEIETTLATNSAEERAALDRRLKDKQDALSGYLQVLPAAVAGGRPVFAYTPRNASDIVFVETLRHAISVTLNRERLVHQGVSSGDIDTLLKPIEIDTSKTGDTQTAFWAAYALFFMMYFVIMQFGMNTARSIIEEKTSRVFEVMLATITPDEMLAGKILGVGAVGLTQVGIWMLAAAGIGAYALATSGASAHTYVSPMQIAFFVAYFLFGFLIYSSIAAALGAMTNSEQELQQLNMFLVMPLAVCMLMLPTMIKNPDSSLARVVSLIPFCSPLLMNFRISIGNPQAWEVALSFVLMTAFIALVLWIASRIYRVGILMYGKKPNLPEIVRWLRYS